MKAEFEERFGHLRRAGKTMDVTASRHRVAPQDVQGVRLGVTGVNHHGQPALLGALKLGLKRRLLDVSRAVVVVKIQADLSPRQDVGVWCQGL